MRKIIGIVGEIGSGKSTVAIYFKHHGYNEYTLATPIKKIAVALGFKPEQVYGNQIDKSQLNDVWNISGREFCQKFGTEVCREYLPTVLPTMKDMWIRLLEKELEKNENIVVSDIRFKNEADVVKKY